MRVLTRLLQWPALSVKWVDLAATQLIFIISDLERFVKDPGANGSYKEVSTEDLGRDGIDRRDLLFTWEKRWYDDGSVEESAVTGSHQEAMGSILHWSSILGANYTSSSSSSASSQSSSLSSVQAVVRSYQWPAVTVEWVEASPVELIYIINNYERFFREPLANGVYKYVPTETLMEGSVDRQDLLFKWEKRWLADGSTEESPVVGSDQEAAGRLKTLIQTVRDNAP